MRPPTRRRVLRLPGGAVCATSVTVVLAASTAALAVNYVPDPGFEACSIGTTWTPNISEQLVCDGADPQTGSFSLALTNAPNREFAGAESDCVVVPPDPLLTGFGFAYRTQSATVYQVALTVDRFTDDACVTSNGAGSTGAGYQYPAPITTDGAWHSVPVSSLVPRVVGAGSETRSVRFTASFQHSPNSAIVTVNFDDLRYADALIFGDPFESQDLGWSGQYPAP